MSPFTIILALVLVSACIFFISYYGPLADGDEPGDNEAAERRASALFIIAAIFLGVPYFLGNIQLPSPIGHWLSVALFVYLLPLIIAVWRGHHETLAISALNVLLGWTFLGWVGAFVWACTRVKRHKSQPPQTHISQPVDDSQNSADHSHAGGSSSFDPMDDGPPSNFRKVLSFLVFLTIVAGGYFLWRSHKDGQLFTTDTASGTAVDDPLTVPRTETNELHNAFAAAFSGYRLTHNKDGSISLLVPGPSEVIFSPAKLIQLDTTKYALISEGTGTENNSCHGCRGRLNISYVQNQNGSFAAFSPKIELEIEGLAWGQVPNWNVLTLSNGPVIETFSSSTHGNSSNVETGGLDFECQTAVHRLALSGIVFDPEASQKTKAKHKHCTNWISADPSEKTEQPTQVPESNTEYPTHSDDPRGATPVNAGSTSDVNSLSDAEIIASPISKPPARYPAGAEERQLEGEVRLEVIIGPDGNVESVIVLSASNPGWFEDAAISNAKSWRFIPSGRKIRFETVIVFKLQ